MFTNGCFDLLHLGHVRYLRAARAQGDVLIVGMNSDRSIRRLKGRGRPILPERERAEVLASLACVDYVTVFDEPDPSALIRVVDPDVLVKGADWPAAQIVGADWVRGRGGTIRRIPWVAGRSTSGIIRKIIKDHSYCLPLARPKAT